MMHPHASTSVTLHTPPPILCRVCNQAKPRNEFFDVPDRLCQDCWEAQVDATWWEQVKDLEPTGYPDEYRRVAREDHGEGEG